MEEPDLELEPEPEPAGLGRGVGRPAKASSASRNTYNTRATERDKEYLRQVGKLRGGSAADGLAEVVMLHRYIVGLLGALPSVPLDDTGAAGEGD